MNLAACRYWLIAAAMLTLASVATLLLLLSAAVIPSVVRNPLADFVQPGIAVWWFALGGPFRSYPGSPLGIVFAGATNAMLWLVAIWLVWWVYRLVRRWLGGVAT